MSRKQLAIGFFACILAGAFAEQSDPPNPTRVVLERISKEFSEAKETADQDFRKRVEPIIERYEKIRAARVKRAGDDAIRDIEKVIESAEKNDDLVGAEMARQELDRVKDMMNEEPTMAPDLSSLLTEFNGHRYLAVLAPVTWKKAHSLCEEMGGHLAYVETHEELLFIETLTLGTPVLVGATDAHKEGDWRWLNKEPVEKALWDRDRPRNERERDYAWAAQGKLHDVPNDDRGIRAFICEWE